MIDRKLLKVINFILLIIRILNVFYFETASILAVGNVLRTCRERRGRKDHRQIIPGREYSLVA